MQYKSPADIMKKRKLQIFLRGKPTNMMVAMVTRWKNRPTGRVRSSLAVSLKN